MILQVSRKIPHILGASKSVRYLQSCGHFKLNDNCIASSQRQNIFKFHTHCKLNKKSATEHKLETQQVKTQNKRFLRKSRPVSILAEVLLEEENNTNCDNAKLKADPTPKLESDFEELEELLTEKQKQYNFVVSQDTEPEFKENEEITNKSQDSENDDYAEVIEVDEKGHTKLKLEKTLEVSFDSGIYDIYSGTPDMSVPITNIPCPGCGANLHCQEPAIPGYIPSKTLKSLTQKRLEKTVCQRCHLINKYQVALKVSSTPEDYIKSISLLKEKQNILVVVVVDVMDMPNSIFPNLSDIIGNDKPIYVLGNKIDLLPKDSTGYLNRTKESLAVQCRKARLTDNKKNIKYVSLISAKTGYGVEELITKLLSDWKKKGVYIYGFF